MRVWYGLLLLAIVGGSVTGEKVRFDNYRVYEVNPSNAAQLQVLQYLEQVPDGVRIFDGRQ